MNETSRLSLPRELLDPSLLLAAGARANAAGAARTARRRCRDHDEASDALRAAAPDRHGLA